MKRLIPRVLQLSSVLLVAGTLVSCADPATSAGEQNSPSNSPADPSAVAAASSGPYPGVNSVRQDRDVWQQLLSDHAAIRRTLVHSEKDGRGIVEATTESDDPIVAARIIEHAKAMQARMKVGAQVRIWDPVFAELFKKHGAVTIEVSPTDKGVKIIESSADPEAVALLRSHAMGVSEFVREGHKAGGQPTARFKTGDPLPAPELTIGGVPHRFLLTQPDAGQLAGLKAAGVAVVINFRKPAEHPEYNEQSAAAETGLSYCNLAYFGAAEITDELLDSSRAAIKAADEKGDTAALHCRTGNRIGPGWAAYRVLDKSIPIEQAISEAKAMRMLDPLMESKTRDYIRRHSAAAKVRARVQWIGGMHKAVHDGDSRGKVAVSSLLRTPHLNAIGPVAGLRGEITVIDGDASVSIVGEKGPTTASTDVEAAFLAWAYVPEWRRVAIPPSVRTQEQLEVFVLEAAKEAGLPADQPLVFRVEGRAQTLALHVIWHEPGDALGKEAHDKAKVPVAVKDEEISIIGFWSTQHLGVFTPMVSPFHMHAWTKGKRISGHVDDVQMQPGGTLLLPARSAASTGGAWKAIGAAALAPAQGAQRDRAVAARDAMFGRLFARLGEAMQARNADGSPAGPAGAISVCKDEAPKIAQAVASEKGVMIGRTSDRLRNPANAAPEWAAGLLADQPVEPRVAANPDGSLGVVLPIKLAANCLACHGSADTIEPAVKAAIAAKYPKDQATGYKEGDLRGWFWVEVPPLPTVVSAPFGQEK